jgi:trans-aconitate 2-methyltransferase
MREWNADAYHRVSDPQFQWGLPVLARLPLRGDEMVVDVGCGTGRLTARLLERLPRGRVIAIDLSTNMISTAHAFLSPQFVRRVSFARANAAALPLAGAADAVFSTATFHWVRDHNELFRSLFNALRPGGRLVAQCGGGPNLLRIHERCQHLMIDREFEPHFRTWTEPWEFADAETTARRLRAAGFVDIATSVEPAPVIQPDARAYREFATTVVCRPHLAALPSAAARDRFMEALTNQAAEDSPPFELDYWRLNMDARKP